MPTTRSQSSAAEHKKFLDALIALNQQAEARFIELGKQLRLCRDEHLYEPVYDSFPLFLDEMKMSPAKASKLINVYEKLVLEYGIDEKDLVAAGGWSAVAEVLPAITDARSARKWVNRAKELDRTSIRKELAEERTGVPMSDCKHEDTYTVRFCRTCKDSFRV